MRLALRLHSSDVAFLTRNPVTARARWLLRYRRWHASQVSAQAEKEQEGDGL